ncbi:hypothetical protein B0J13DRAFT_670860 [Dactylonectria estremocensis]|uniref:Zn(2)-C6 fungal-type domain-containing protein n=1 Tax=Dactylonectria estremocensis TaxID=1079267 RepID=A0A9P9FG04_9HYPO|nr:hypothetical protein B0J13DRAFT_670860 [Dactylonectria estremocensis]
MNMGGGTPCRTPRAVADKVDGLDAPPQSRVRALRTPLWRQAQQQQQYPRSRLHTPGQRRLTTASSNDSLASPSPQQEPNSAEYLSRLINLSQYRARDAQSRIIPMADFLASFNLSAPTPALSHNLPCSSVGGLQLQLRSVLDAKAAPNRAEHVSITLELGAMIQFTIVAFETENGDHEASTAIDPALGGGPSTSVTEQQIGARPSQVVGAGEALMSQQDDPSLQRSVARHIMDAVGATDGCVWTFRGMSQEAQGWKFTYMCKDSFQQWRRQHAKHLTKVIVGEYSQREPDSTLSRPAFDCRGTVIVDFDRKSRAITVKYGHTPLHKTVAELSEYFRPTPRPLGPGAQKLLQQKTPRRKRAEGKAEKKAQDELRNPRKRKKKNDGESQPVLVGDSAPVPGDGQYPQSQEVESAQNQRVSGDYPEDLLTGGSTQTRNQAKTQKTVSQPPTGVTFPVQIPPAEAARRREAAMTMLSEAGVPPDSLSADQFNIFSNQSPDLQKESLSMLVKYGAERLRIVHPNNKGASSSASATTFPGRTSLPSPSGLMTTEQLAPQGGGSGDAETVNGSVANNGDDGTATPAPEPTPTGKSKRKPGKSRNACFPCKARKVKCPRERPTCTQCATEGLVCEFAPPKLRQKKPKVTETVADEPANDAGEGCGEDEVREDAEGDESNLDDAGQNGSTQNYSFYPEVSVSDDLTPSAGAHMLEPLSAHTNYFYPSSNSTLPQDETPSTGHHTITADPGHNYNTTMTDQTSHIDHQTVPAETSADSSAQNPWDEIEAVSRSRRNIDSGSDRVRPPVAASTNNQPSSNWHTPTNSLRPVAVMAPPPSHMSHPETVSRTSQNLNHQPAQPALVRDGPQPTQRVSEWASAAIQHHHQFNTASAARQAPARKSPLQAVKAAPPPSRPSPRSQSRTSLNDNPTTKVYEAPRDPKQYARANNSARYTSDQMSGASKQSDRGGSRNTNTAVTYVDIFAATFNNDYTISSLVLERLVKFAKQERGVTYY